MATEQNAFRIPTANEAVGLHHAPGAAVKLRANRYNGPLGQTLSPRVAYTEFHTCYYKRPTES